VKGIDYLDYYPIVIVGNKFDLDEERQVSEKEGVDYCAKRNIPFYEASAKTRYNVDEIFFVAIRKRRDYKKNHLKYLKKESKEKKDCVVS
jgi:GTPase SAR1 family protein